MNILKFLNAFICVAGLPQIVGCASIDERPPPDNFVLQITDNPSDRRFDIKLESYDKKAICVLLENWPSSFGQLHMGADIATLHTTNGDIQARDANFGYCPGGCGEHRIAPGGTLQGFIAYNSFGDEDQIASASSKQLEFSPSPYYCSKR